MRQIAAGSLLLAESRVLPCGLVMWLNGGRNSRRPQLQNYWHCEVLVALAAQDAVCGLKAGCAASSESVLKARLGATAVIELLLQP
jgi:hypothetical protein